MLLSFTNSDGSLTTGGIIAIVFFIIAILAIIGLTVSFAIYKSHVKKTYNVERRLTRLLNHPIEKKIRRLSNIAETNDDFADQVDDVKIIYTSEIVKRLNALSANYEAALKSKKIWNVNKTNSAITSSWLIALDKIDAEINVLSTVTDILINTELSLRDDLVDFMKEWNNIEDHFENLKDNSDNEKNFIDQDALDNFNKQKNIYLANYDKAISNGDFAQTKEVYNKLNDLGKLLLKETNLYPSHIDYFTKQYPQQKEELVDNNTVNESVRKLKKSLDIEEEKVRQSIKSKDYNKAIDGIDKVFNLIDTYRHNRKLENAFELFIETSGKDLENFFNEVEESLAVVKKEDSDDYAKVVARLQDELVNPIQDIKKSVSKIEKETSKSKTNNETLNDQRIKFADNLVIVDRGIELLKSIKTKDEKIEQDYVEFLSEELKAKSTLIAIKNLLTNPNNGLSKEDELVDEKLINTYQEQIDRDDVSDVNDFDNRYPDASAKVGIINKLKEINKRLNTIYQSVQDAYRYYNLAVAIKIMYTDIKEPEYAPIWDKLLELFYKGQYKEFVQNYIKESEIQR